MKLPLCKNYRWLVVGRLTARCAGLTLVYGLSATHVVAWMAADRYSKRMGKISAIAFLVFGFLFLSHPDAVAKSMYCGNESANLMLGSSSGAEGDVLSVYKYCNPGDILPIPGNDTAVIAQVCNFSKSIIREPNGTVLCMVGPMRPMQ